MNAALRKLKTETKNQKRKSATSRVDNESLTQSEVLSAWKAQLESFKSERFSSIDEARAALISGVVARMKVPKNSQSKLAQFLEVVLEADPDVDEILAQFVTP